MVHYVDDEGDDPNERLCRSMLNMIELCRMSAARLNLNDEGLRSDLVASLAHAASIVEQLRTSAPPYHSARS
jgi:hypothetical protein